MISEHNLESGNAGIIFWTDILIPPIVFILLWLHCRYEIEGRSIAPGPAAPHRGTAPTTPTQQRLRLFSQHPKTHDQLLVDEMVVF
jgi:hypothetical protein